MSARDGGKYVPKSSHLHFLELSSTSKSSISYGKTCSSNSLFWNMFTNVNRNLYPVFISVKSEPVLKTTHKELHRREGIVKLGFV